MQSSVCETIEVGLGANSYPILIGRGFLSRLGDELLSRRFSRKVALVSNDKIFGLHGATLRSGLEAAGFEVFVILIGDGEEFKTQATLSDVYDQLIETDMDRSCGIIALGGGVVGDLAGYAAATYMRGIPFVQVPTTLLAQVDSSVGGKTAVNHPKGKNIIGAFYQPRLVCIDVDVLSTLEDREYISGLAEVVKYGIIRDRLFFDWLATHVETLLSRDADALVHAIKTSCQIKADIVEIDEKESGVRAYLNLGHTFGHAVETLTGYSRYLHGEAVAIGMLIAARISAGQGRCNPQEVAAIRDLLERFRLPITPPEFTVRDFVSAMMHDKKVKDGVLRMVLNHGIGQCEIVDIQAPAEVLSPILAS